MAEKVQPNAVLVIGTDGKLEITRHTDIALSGSTKTELRVDPAPITLKVETATDWAAVFATGLVGIAGILTALVVGWFTHKGAHQAAAAMEKSAQQAAVAMEKSALQAAAATAAGIRNEWMQDLRNEAAGFYAALLDIAYAILVGKGELNTENGDEVKVFKMHKHRAVITMMLDASKPLVQQLIKVMDGAAKAVSDGDQMKIVAESNAFKAQATLLLEDAWQDIKNDLYGAAKKKKIDTA
jgi:hypothetical protein